MFQDSFQDFAPAPPASVYAGVRQKMRWAGFLGFHYSTFNVWYLGLILAGSSAIILSQAGEVTSAGTADVKASFDQNVRMVSLLEVVDQQSSEEETASWNVVVSETPVVAQPIFEAEKESELVFIDKSDSNLPETLPTMEISEAEKENISSVVESTSMTQIPVRSIELGNVLAIENDLLRQLKSNNNTIEFAIKVKLPSTKDQ